MGKRTTRAHRDQKVDQKAVVTVHKASSKEVAQKKKRTVLAAKPMKKQKNKASAVGGKVDADLLPAPDKAPEESPSPKRRINTENPEENEENSPPKVLNSRRPSQKGTAISAASRLVRRALSDRFERLATRADTEKAEDEVPTDVSSDAPDDEDDDASVMTRPSNHKANKKTTPIGEREALVPVLKVTTKRKHTSPSSSSLTDPALSCSSETRPAVKPTAPPEEPGRKAVHAIRGKPTLHKNKKDHRQGNNLNKKTTKTSKKPNKKNQNKFDDDQFAQVNPPTPTASRRLRHHRPSLGSTSLASALSSSRSTTAAPVSSPHDWRTSSVMDY